MLTTTARPSAALPHAVVLWLPEATSVGSLLPRFAAYPGVTVQPAFAATRCVLDTFDWRLFGAGYYLECLRHGSSTELCLGRLDRPGWQRRVEVREIPRGVDSLPAGLLAERLAPIMGNRVLLQQGEQRLRLARAVQRDVRGKTTVTLELSARPRRQGVRVQVLPVTGYDGAARSLAKALRRDLGAVRCRTSSFEILTRDCDPAPGTMPGWREPFGIEPAMRTDQAVKQGLRHYTRIMALNIEGAALGLDPEFLHDFRVGVRRCRSVLKRLGATLPPQRVTAFSADFRWLGQATSGLRDLDVLMEEFPRYAAMLQPQEARALGPVLEELSRQHVEAQETFARLLRGARFRRRWGVWQRWLDAPIPAASARTEALRPCTKGAQRAIARLARKVYRLGDGIDGESPAEHLHELRKLLKNLRYLMDLFEELIPRKHLKRCLVRLKMLQEALGEYQDLEVHGAALADKAARLDAAQQVPPEVMQALAEVLHQRVLAARETALSVYPDLRALCLHRHPFGA
jgi:CHAD domain-containing protein